VISGLLEVATVVVSQRLLVSLGKGVLRVLGIQPPDMVVVVVHGHHTRGLLVGHAPANVVHMAFLVFPAVCLLEVGQALELGRGAFVAEVADLAAVARRLQVRQAGGITSLTRVVDPYPQETKKKKRNLYVYTSKS
jgi:hypothetical protein